MKYLFTAFYLFLVFVAAAQTPSLKKSPMLSEAKPETVGISAQRLARIDSMCLQAIAKGEVPGMVALVARHNKIVYYKAFGMADDSLGRVLKRDDIFRIASQTKAITATAVMMLWEECKFGLDDPISKFIPEFKNPRVLKTFRFSDTTFTTEPAKSEITIRHLLTHTSGLGYGIIDGDERFKMLYNKAGVTDLFTTDTISIGESVKKLAGLPLHHQPGEKFTYSEGLDVLGYLVEIVSGMPFDVFLKTRLFDPLGMKDTWFYLPDDKASRLVPVQQSQMGKWVRYPFTFYDPAYPVTGAKRFFSGGAGLSSTVVDYANFLQMYLNGGELNGVRILSRTTIQSMMGNQTKDLMNDPGAFYGLAFGVINQTGQDIGGRGSAGTFDWGGYFNTSYFADPKEGVIGLLFKQTQKANSDGTRSKFRVLVGQAIDD